MIFACTQYVLPFCSIHIKHYNLNSHNPQSRKDLDFLESGKYFPLAKDPVLHCSLSAYRALLSIVNNQNTGRATFRSNPQPLMFTAYCTCPDTSCQTTLLGMPRDLIPCSLDFLSVGE